MTFETIQAETHGALGVIRLNQPQTLNAITAGMVSEISAAVDQLSGSARALLLTANGRAFCSGANLVEMGRSSDEEPRDAGALLESHVNPLLRKLSELTIPWLCAVNGPAVGVGCSLALAADLILAAESAYFLQAFTRIGLVPDGGSNWLLTRAIGRVRAMEMMLLADRIPADQALQWGLINRVVADSELSEASFALATVVANGPTRALGLVRRLAWLAADASWPEVLEAERRAQREAGGTADVREGIAAFLEKRAPRFEGA